MENWEQALAELARERGTALKRHAFLLCGDDSQAEGLVQEALGRAFSRPLRVPRPDRGEAYVRAIMVNLFIDDAHTQSRWGLVAPLSWTTAETAGPADQVDVRGATLTALQSLSPAQRACLVLRYYEDLPVAEVAAGLGVSDDAVSRYLSEATSSVAAQLSSAEGEERELRSRLEETAARAEAPRFTAEDVAAPARRIRRRRRNRAWIAAAVGVAAVTSAVVIPVTSGGTGQVARSAAPDMSFAVAMNDEYYAVPGPTGPGEYYVTTGQNLTITVNVDVSARTQVTALSIGISDGLLGSPMKQVLASSSRVPLRPGVHRFVLHWTAPAGLGPGNIRLLAAHWAWSGRWQGEVDQAIAVFAARPGLPFSAAAVDWLVPLMLQEARACNDRRPAWLWAIRTMNASAESAIGLPEPRDPDVPVYLLVMKGNFTPDHATMPPCAHAPAGHFFYTVVDAATFAKMSERLTNQTPLGELKTIGPASSLPCLPCLG
jgi:RNA polymerase sigma factor (sigma-70 family)